MSALPILLVLGGETALETALRAAVLLEWLRSAGRAGRGGGWPGDIVPFLAWTVLSGLAMPVRWPFRLPHAARLPRRAELGTSTRATDGRARMPLSGPLGTLVEKDLRVAWRDPAVRAGLLMGSWDRSCRVLLSQARGVGRAARRCCCWRASSGSRASARTRSVRAAGIALLLGFPVERCGCSWQDVGSLVFRAPGLLTVLMVGLVSRRCCCPPRS